MYSNSGVVLVVGLILVGYGLLAFNRAHMDRTATGGYGSGLSPGGREFLSVIIVLFGLGTMFAAVIGY